MDRFILGVVDPYTANTLVGGLPSSIIISIISRILEIPLEDNKLGEP